MLNSLAANIGLVVFAAVSERLAGGSITGDVTTENLDRTVAVGRHINSIKFDVTIEKSTASGILEYAVFKIERADTTPLLGTLLPTSAEVASAGLQQAIRKEQPGRVYHYGALPFTPETTRRKTFRVNFAKFKKTQMRSGDHIGIFMFQRNSNTGTIFNVEMMYKTHD